MATLTPVQDYDHLLDIISGYDGMHDLQKKAAPADSVTFSRGALVFLDSDGNLTTTCPSETAMPLWAINASDDYDTSSESGGTVGNNINTIVATGGYEITTTEFDAGTYAENTLLAAGTAGKVAEAAAKYSLKLVLGVVSDGKATDVYGQATVTFWPVFIPGVSAGTFVAA